MKKYGKKIEDRKVLVTRLSDITGIEAHYTRVPRCAYEIGDFTVEKDGTLAAEDNADQSIIETLILEGLIMAAGEQEPQAEAASANAPQEFETEEWEDDGWSGIEESPAEETPAEETEEIPAPAIQEENQQAEAEDAAAEENTARPEEDDEPETPCGTGDAEEADGGEQDEPVSAAIAFPLSQHTAGSLVNLVCMVYSRGLLLSKATGGEFYANRELVDALLDHPAFIKPADVAEFLKNRDHREQRLVGLTIDEEKVVFDGFGTVRDADHLNTFTKLAAAMNRMAITQKRVQAKEVNDANEKYALRVWLIRIGMNGSGYKEDRKRLLENLSGHTAFRNETDKARWEARQASKRKALKAAKNGDQTKESSV